MQTLLPNLPQAVLQLSRRPVMGVLKTTQQAGIPSPKTSPSPGMVTPTGSIWGPGITTFLHHWTPRLLDLINGKNQWTRSIGSPERSGSRNADQETGLADAADADIRLG